MDDSLWLTWRSADRQSCLLCWQDFFHHYLFPVVKIFVLLFLEIFIFSGSKSARKFKLGH